MAHIGSFVPAKEATVGLIDQIFSRIYSRYAFAYEDFQNTHIRSSETASVRTSSFMIGTELNDSFLFPLR